MDLKEMIYKRKSIRKYKPEPVDAETIQKIYDFCNQLRPLYPDIKVRPEIMNREQIKCLLPWKPAQVLVFFSEEKEGYLENVGFLFQQLDLYLPLLGLGACWLGMGKLDSYAESNKKDGLGFVIMMAFGYPKEEFRSNVSEFKRKSLSEISDKEDFRLEPARLAPSSINSQPWYFTHDGEKIHVYCIQKGFFKTKSLEDMNRIDVGISLAHMYVTNPETFHFMKESLVEPVKGYQYLGSFTLNN